jgi:hypothetical protein
VKNYSRQVLEWELELFFELQVDIFGQHPKPTFFQIGYKCIFYLGKFAFDSLLCMHHLACLPLGLAE